MVSRRKFIQSTSLLSTLAGINGNAQTSLPPSKTSVLIIGGGPAGLSIADKLSMAGVDVLVVESGVNEPTHRHQLLNTVTGSKEPIASGLGMAGRRALGGTTHIWGGITPRLQESDFNTLSDYGYGLDWPISYSELEKYYCEAGKWLGNRDILCARDKPSPFAVSSLKLLEELKNINIDGCLPASMSVDNRGVFSPINLSDTHVTRNNFQILKDATVRRLDINKKGQVLGVHYSKTSGADDYIKADTVILCAGAIQNARLLLLSENSLYPDGIGNASGNVGCNFMDHPNIQYWIEPKKRLLEERHSRSFVHSYHFYDKMKSKGMGSALLRFGIYRKNWHQTLNYKFLPESAGIAAPSQRLMVEALCEQEAQSNNCIALDKDILDQFGDGLAHLTFKQNKRDIETIVYISNQLKILAQELGNNYVIRPLNLSSHHLMGTTRMSDSELDGVVDSNLKVHGTTNLYISGASVFPSGGAANPTLTLTALSFRLVDHLLSADK